MTDKRVDTSHLRAFTSGMSKPIDLDRARALRGGTAAVRWVGDLTEGRLSEDLERWAKPFGTDWAALWTQCERPDWMLELAAIAPVPMNSVIGATAEVLDLELSRLARHTRTRGTVVDACRVAVDSLEQWSRGACSLSTCYDAIADAVEVGEGSGARSRDFVREGLVNASDMLAGGEGRAFGQVWRAALLHLGPGVHGRPPDAKHSPALIEAVRSRITADAFAHALDRAARRQSAVRRMAERVPFVVDFERPFLLWCDRHGDDLQGAWRACPWPAWQMVFVMAPDYSPDRQLSRSPHSPVLGRLLSHCALRLAFTTVESIPDILPGAVVGALGDKARRMLDLAIDLCAVEPGKQDPASRRELQDLADRLGEAASDSLDAEDPDPDVRFPAYVLAAAADAAEAVLGDSYRGALLASDTVARAISEIETGIHAERFGAAGAELVRCCVPEGAMLERLATAAAD